jgi:Helix-turn-helix domain
MNEERDFKGVWIKKEIWLNTNLTLIEKVLIVEIDSLDNSDRGCFASNEYLAKFVNLSEGRVANILSDLKKRDFIIQLFFDGRNRGLRINKHKCESSFNENVKADFTKTTKQHTRKREHNNTINNTHNNTDYIYSENEFSPTEEEIKNPFTRKARENSVAYEQSKKERKESSAKEKKEKTEPRQPSDIYLAYEIFCTFHESVSAAKYPRTLNGNFILNPIDARNVKLLLEWVEKIDPDNKMENFRVFVQAAWMLEDKYIKANYNIGLLYRQCTQIYAKVQNSNPMISKQKREEQRNAEAAEFLRERYGIVN